MNFSLYINQSLNKNIILSHITEEQIFSFYIGNIVKSNKLFCSKLRVDKNPTCSFYRNKNGTLIYKDFATNQNLNCFEYVKELFHCDYFTALDIIANDFNIVNNPQINKNKGKIISNNFRINEKEISRLQVEIKDFSELELNWWSKFGITLDILKKFNVYSCKHVFLNGQIIAKSQQSCPIYGYYGGKIKKNSEKIELWKCYFPTRREYRFLGNYPSKKLQGYEQLPKTGKLCVITKSMKDCLTLYSLGFNACAPNSETVIPSETIIKDLKSRFKYVIALWDNDYTGITFLNKFKKKYPELLYTWIPRKYNAKDISDYYKLWGKKKTQQLIIDFLKYIK